MADEQQRFVPTADAPQEQKKQDEDPKQGLDKIIPGVQVEEASAPMQLDTTKRESRSGKFIKHTGVATVRIMDEKAWRSVHVDSDRYFEWNALNRKMIPIEAFTDEELTYLLRVDGRFEIVEVKEEEKAEN